MKKDTPCYDVNIKDRSQFHYKEAHSDRCQEWCDNDNVICHNVITTNLAMIDCTFIDLEGIARVPAIQKVSESYLLQQQNMCKIKSKITG